MADTQSARNVVYSPTPFSTWLGIVCLFIVFGVIVFAVIGPMRRGSDYEQTRAQKRMERLKALHEETQKDLTTYAWVDKNKGVARIPIERAMELTAADLAQQSPAPAGPIATPAAQTAPAGAPPAPAASPRSGAAQLPQAKASAAATAPVSSSPAKAAGKPGPPAAANTSPSPAAPSPSAPPASPAPATTP